MEYELNKKLQSAFCGIFKHLNLKKFEQNLFLAEMGTIESQNWCSSFTEEKKKDVN